MISRRLVLMIALMGAFLSGCSHSSVPVEYSGIRYPSVAFVVTCRLSHELPDDPIVHPGKPGASHRHSFFGNMTTSARSTQESMAGAPTTCSDPLDTGAYWAPSPAGRTLRAYYDRGSVDQQTVTAPPVGTKLISGNPSASTPVGIDTVAFRCGVISDGPDRGEWLPEAPSACGGGALPIVRFTFAQCAGRCTDESPRFARLRLVMDWAGQSPMGIAPHADFWNTWNQARLDELTAVCIRGERTTNLAIKQCGLPGAS